MSSKNQARKRAICVFSGKRGGFGAYLPLMQLIEEDPELELRILLGDMHASVEFGKTVDEARHFFPKANIEVIDMGSGRGDTPLIRAENLGTCLSKASSVLSRMRPDIVLVHGDRGEHLMVAFAALNLGIPVAHTQGGEVSGNIDDTIRHAITKLAHIHFPETESAAARIRALGEESSRIHVVGSTYIDRIGKHMYTPTEEVKAKFGLRADEEYFLLIYHPDTYETADANAKAMETTLSVLKATGLRTIVTYPASDPGYEGIVRTLGARGVDISFIIRKNINNLDFLGLMAGAKAIVGNSSSALVEAPYFKLPALNIGKRQIGRDREENVVDADPNTKDIASKLDGILNDPKFRKQLAQCGYRLGSGHAAEKILDVLRQIPINEALMRKALVVGKNPSEG